MKQALSRWGVYHPKIGTTPLLCHQSHLYHRPRTAIWAPNFPIFLNKQITLQVKKFTSPSFPLFFLSLLFVPRRRNPIFCFTLKEVRFSCARQSFMFPQSATKNYDIKIMMMKKINIVSYVPLAPPIFFYICFILFGNIPSLRPERIQVPAPANVFHNLYILKPSSSKV